MSSQPLVPTVDFFGHQVSRLICGGNPLSGFSHFSAEMDWDMVEYYTMPNIQALLDECLANGINTFQSRGDRHQMRAFLEHRLSGGEISGSRRRRASFAPSRGISTRSRSTSRSPSTTTARIRTTPGTQARSTRSRDIVKHIKDKGLPAGIGTHIPAVIEYAEEKGWETDFYMGCLYNLARGNKAAPAQQRNAYAQDRFPAEDPAAMCRVLKSVAKPCIGFKLMAASRNCATVDSTRKAFEFAFANLKSTDIVDVGMFQKYKNQVAENAALVREILAGAQVK